MNQRDESEGSGVIDEDVPVAVRTKTRARVGVGLERLEPRGERNSLPVLQSRRLHARHRVQVFARAGPQECARSPVRLFFRPFAC
jgi:hypothetical protein